MSIICEAVPQPKAIETVDVMSEKTLKHLKGMAAAGCCICLPAAASYAEGSPAWSASRCTWLNAQASTRGRYKMSGNPCGTLRIYTSLSTCQIMSDDCLVHPSQH